jgi:predicted AlkP superfamily pyrophosphatase or phosphodiesterase
MLMPLRAIPSLALLVAFTTGDRSIASSSRPVVRYAATRSVRPHRSSPTASFPAGHSPPPTAASPTLVVFFTIDQMRADYFERFLPQLDGGLGRLYRGGAVFTNGFQDHAVTETAPGHATVLSGREPWKTGIVANAQGVLDAQDPLVAGAKGDPASPYRFRGSTLIDWIRIADSRSQALSVSRKDRGAILPLGRAHQSAVWYSPDGVFTTSRYYADTLAGWLSAFNARHLPQSFAGQRWMPARPDSEYPEPDSVAIENGGKEVSFPHPFPADSAAAAKVLARFPQMDQVTLAAALAGVRGLNLGAGPQVDLLAVSLSTTDAIGHAFGPDSKELHDQVLWLDRYLGSFLDSLFALRDSTRVIVALTGDHGVAPFPEVHSGRYPNRAAAHVDVSGLVEYVAQALPRRSIDRGAWRWENGMLWVDREAMRRGGLDPDSVLRVFATRVRAVAGVARVDSYERLTKADTTVDAVARRWLHMFPADLAPALVVTLTPYSVWGNGTSAEHGSPYDYDAHVPIVFYGAPFRRGRYAAFARVTDMAPTLAATIGVRPTERLDGRVLLDALQPALAAR